MAWWLWVLLGFALVLCELLTPGGFFFLFFGLGAVAVGALVWLGAAGPAWLQWFLFSLISIGFLVPLRGRLLRRMATGDDAAARVDALVGQVAVLLDDLRSARPGDAGGRADALASAGVGGHMLSGALIVFLVLAVLILFVLSRTAVVVPQQSAFVVERLGRYRATLDAGFHILLPFVDGIRYRHSLKENALDIPEQICITKDNVQVHVDGVLYLKVMNPERASYGVADYLFAITQLAQTALRSEIGKIELDRTFEERTHINLEVVNELDKATEPWGIKVLRYEIKNITPPADVLAAMEKQMRAEREKRAVILPSEGQRDAAINSAEGEKQQVIKASEAKKQQQINEAEGQAAAILAVADATAEGIRKVAEAINLPGGYEAVQLRVAEQYIGQFGQLAKESNTMVLPASVADVGSMIALAMNVIGRHPNGPGANREA